MNNRDGRRRVKGFFAHLVLSWTVPAVVILFWQLSTHPPAILAKLLPHALWLNLLSHSANLAQTFPGPSQIFQAGAHLWKTGELLSAIEISSQRAAFGFLVGGSVGFALGLFNGLFSFAETMLDSSIQMLRNIPHLALIPIIILWFGIDEPAKVLLVAIGVFFPIYLNTFHGIRSIDPALREMASVYGLKSWSLFWNVILPGAMPSILVGIRFALGLMWLTLIVAETIDADSGIGYITNNAREFMQTDVVLMGILLYALLGKLADASVRLLERILLSWQPAYQR